MKRLLALLCCCAVLSAQAAPEVKPFVRGSVKEIAAARQGQPYILAFWSLTCTHCRDELKLLGDLLKQHPALSLAVVSTDPPEEASAIAATLAEYRLERAEAWVFADSFSERLRADVDRKWHGELPRTYLYDGNHQATAISGKIDLQQIERWLRAAP